MPSFDAYSSHGLFASPTRCTSISARSPGRIVRFGSSDAPFLGQNSIGCIASYMPCLAHFFGHSAVGFSAGNFSPNARSVTSALSSPSMASATSASVFAPALREIVSDVFTFCFSSPLPSRSVQ